MPQKRKKVEEPKKEEAPEWIVSFTDMTSLEMAFFIVLMSFSTPRREKLAAFQGSIEGAFGLLGREQRKDSATPPLPILQGRDPLLRDAPNQIPRFQVLETHESRAEIMRLKDRSGVALDVDRILEGWRLRLKSGIAFAPGDERMTSDSFATLSQLCVALRDVPFRVVVLGYGDRGDASDAHAVDLGLRRAVGVAGVMARDHGIDGARLAVAGYPSTSDAGGKVEIILADDPGFQRGGRR